MADINVRNGDQIDLVVEKSSDPIDLNIEKESGVSDYNRLTGKPIINSIVVEGSKVGLDYRLQDKMDTLTVQEVERIFYVGD